MMPTKPLQVAFWSLLTGFVSILVLSTLQIDTRPMTIIAGNRTNGAIENSIASSETDRGVRPQPASVGIESPPPPDSSSLVSVGQSGMTSHEMTWTNTSHRHDHIVRDPDPAASPTDQHANAPNNDDEALIEIGTIVIPSLTSNRTSAAAQQSDQQIQQFAGRDQRIADLEQRLDRLQEKLDHLLTTQAEHQTVELESMTQLVDQLQKDREIHRLRQQLDELQREQRQLTSAAESNPPSTVDDARDHESAQTAQRDDASVTIEPPRVSASPPKKEGWTAVAPFDHEEQQKSGNQIPATPQSPTSRHSGDVPLPRETVAGVPRATSPIVIPETTSENELEIPVPPPEDVDPRSFDVEDVPFRVNSGDLPNFKLPPESRETSNQPEIERQPQSRTEPPGGKRRNDRLHTTEERDYTAPPDTTTPHPAQSESTSSRTTVVPKHPASLANTNIEPSTIAHHRPSPRTSLIVDAVVFNVRMQNPQRAGIEWDRLRTDGGRMLVDFAPTTVRNIEETGLALGALQGDISTLQSRLAAIADVEIVSKQQLTLNEQNVEFIHLNSKAFASDADASANDPATNAGYQLRIQSHAVENDRKRLLLSLIDPSDPADISLSGDAIVADGETLVIGGMIFEEVVDLPAEESRSRKLPFLGRKKLEKKQSRIQTEQVIVLTFASEISTASSTAEQVNSSALKRPAATRALAHHRPAEATSPEEIQRLKRLENLAVREYELAAQFYEKSLYGPAIRHVQLSLELNPDNPRARKLADQLAAKHEY